MLISVSCQEFRNNKHRVQCDRNFPCSVCVKRGKHCKKKTHMTKLKKPSPPAGSNINNCKISNSASGSVDMLDISQNLNRACKKLPLRKKQLPLKDQLRYDPEIQHLVAPNVAQSSDGTWQIQASLNVINAAKELPKNSTSGRKQTKARFPIDPNCEIQPLAAPHISQRSDGAWQSTQQRSSPNNNTNRKRKAQMFQSVDISPAQKKQSSRTSLAIAPRPANQRAKKRNFEDQDFDPVADATGDTSIEDITSYSHPRARKPKGPRAYLPYHKPQQDHLPDPYGKPPVWAAKRQQLCETLPYYRAYMSGAYMHDGLVSGSLIDKEVGIRDVFDDEVIITRW